jgi:glycosyltransferase involved in cell wall biosynthesis
MNIDPRHSETPVDPEEPVRNELRSKVPEWEARGEPTPGTPGTVVFELPLGAPAESRRELELEDEVGFSAGALRAFRGGLNAAGHHPGEVPIRLMEFTRAFYLGGTETQLVELLRGLPGHYQVRIGALQAKGPLYEVVRALGHQPRTFPLGARFLRPGTAAQIARLAAWLRQERIELLHVHDFAGTLVAVPAAKLAGAKVVVSRLDLAHYHSPMQRLLLAALTRLADHVIVNAEAIRAQLVREERLPRERISLVRNGIDLARFDRRRALGLEGPIPETGDDPVLIHVANMNHEVKRQEDLLEALAELQRAGKRVQAFLVGDGPRRELLERLASAQGLSGRVHFLGHRTDVPALFGRARLGVLCSSAEGLPNVVIEGMAAGLPMVVTDVGGSAELVGRGAHGWAVPPCQPRALARAIAEVLEAPERAAEAGRRARAYVERELSLERMVSGHDAVYRCVCSS